MPDTDCKYQWFTYAHDADTWHTCIRRGGHTSAHLCVCGAEAPRVLDIEAREASS